MTSSGLSVVLSSFMTFLCSSSSTVWSTLHPVWQNNTLSYPWPIPLRHPSFPTHNQVLGFYLPKAFQTSLLFPISNNHHLSSSQHNLLPRLLQQAGLTSSPFSTVISVIFFKTQNYRGEESSKRKGSFKKECIKCKSGHCWKSIFS